MNERINESLSALLDGEADELEIRRLLNQTEQDDQLLDKWASYQMIGAVMRQEPVLEIDLAKGVRQALDGEPMDELPQSSVSSAARRSWHKLAASGAIAASVMVAVLVGVQWQQTSETSVVNQAPLAALEASTTTAEEAAPMPVLVAQSTEATTLSAEQQQQLEAAQRRLQEYVLRHSEQDLENAIQPMLPFMQTVKFTQEGEARR